MTGLFWLASLLLLGLAGLPLLLHRAFAGYPLSTRLVLAGASGAALVSFAMTAAVLLGVPWNVPGLVAAGAALAAGLRLFLKPPLAFTAAAPRPAERGESPAGSRGRHLCWSLRSGRRSAPRSRAPRPRRICSSSGARRRSSSPSPGRSMPRSCATSSISTCTRTIRRSSRTSGRSRRWLREECPGRGRR